MKKILMNGVDGNLGSKAAAALLEKWPHEDLIFTASTKSGAEKYKDTGVETRVADFNDEEGLADVFRGADTMVLVSMPFVGPKRRAAQKRALDAAVKAGVKRLVYTSVVGAGEDDIDAYEVNDHVWFEAYIKEQPIHYVILRDSQYAEAMVSSYINAYENTDSILANNMGDGLMAFVSRDDCAFACACAAMSDLEDCILNINGAEPMTIAKYISIANEVTGHNVKYVEISDEEQYAFFDSIGVPRTTEDMWAQTASNFPFCSDGMVSFGRAIRKGQMSVFTDDFEKLTGRKPLSVKEIFTDMENHTIGSRVSTD